MCRAGTAKVQRSKHFFLPHRDTPAPHDREPHRRQRWCDAQFGTTLKSHLLKEHFANTMTAPGLLRVPRAPPHPVERSLSAAPLS
jgi:hypothetical protein